MSKLAVCVGILETLMNGISNESTLSLDDRGKIVDHLHEICRILDKAA